MQIPERQRFVQCVRGDVFIDWVSTFELPTFIQPNTDYEEDYAVALVRCHDDGTGTIVYGCNEAGVIDAVLISSGKDLDQRAQDSKAQVDAGDLAERRARDVREFTSKMITLDSMPNATVNGGALRTNGAATPHYGYSLHCHHSPQVAGPWRHSQ